MSLSKASTGARLTRWHLEAGIACEHTVAPSVEQTNWRQIVELYDALLTMNPGPIVAINRAVAVAALGDLDAARAALTAFANDKRVVTYPFFWAALADLETRAGRTADAVALYARAIALTRSPAERLSLERKQKLLTS